MSQLRWHRGLGPCASEAGYCTDTLDNDLDGSVDCLDPDCSGYAPCEFGTELTCDDSFDNDADGFVDCLDTDCDGVAGCEYGIELTCNDTLDNDEDGATDCQDLDCEEAHSCLGEYDAFVDHYQPNRNTGHSARFSVRNGDGYGSNRYTWDGLVRFFVDHVPPGSTVTSATIRLYYWRYRDNNPTGRSLRCNRVTEPWDEYTVTWNTRPSHASSPTSTASVPGQYGWMYWDVTQDVQDIVDGAVENFGWKIRDEGSWGTYNIPIADFYSRENIELVPQLVIDYH